MVKKKIIIIGIAIIIIFLVIVGILFYLISKEKAEKEGLQAVPPKEKTLEKVLRDLTAPLGKAAEVSEKTLKSLTAPQKKVPSVSKEILDSLTPPGGNSSTC